MNDAAIVQAVCDLASQGTYKEVTPQGARNMNRIFELAADLINRLEADEACAAAEVELQAMAQQFADDDEAEGEV